MYELNVITPEEQEARLKELERQDARKANKESKNPDHFQIYMANNMNEMSKMDGSSIKLLMMLANVAFEGHCNRTEEAYVVISLDALVALTQLTKPTIIKSSKVLEEAEWIKVFKCGNTNVYAINPYRMWKSEHDKKHKALYNKDNIEGYVVRGNIVIDSKPERR